MSSGENAAWLRHRDFYVEQGELPGRPGDPPTEEEIRSSWWGRARRAPSYPAVLFIRMWRKLISPLYGQVCAFYPSCSAYGLEAVTAHGLIRGSALTLWRILRCNPFTGGGVDHVPCAERIWPAGELPAIIETNHPPIDRDASSP
ncbi:membrane protein insertion efficiency factor YidD [Nesterenkonia populi]|uniref:membrane protein insertion efficiency factor YidD n=1 Tax=Nesterenkonia populi TaxID=1591087 RepID=UPI001FE80CE3|nr:membrane protein insertion efficiency factor YidD [Nesterenkonia populi]